MNWLEFTFGDYRDPSTREYLALIGEIISISNYIDDQLREIFHEMLFNHYFDVAAIVFENIKNIDQKQKIIKSMSKRMLTDNLQQELNAILVDIKRFSEKRNAIAHSVLAPKNDLSNPGERTYIMRKAAVPYFEQKIKIDELDPLRNDLTELAEKLYLLRDNITFHMKFSGRKSVK